MTITSADPKDHVRILYLRDEKKNSDAKGHPVACVAFTCVRGMNDVNIVKFAFCTLNPHDTFNRARALTIAKTRLTRRPTELRVRAPGMHDVVKSLMNELIAIHNDQRGEDGTNSPESDPLNQDCFPLVPSRTMKAAKRWLVNAAAKADDKTV